jgi:hypothetical protein
VRWIAVALSSSLSTARYDNTLAPPSTVMPEQRMRLSRAGFGLVARAIVPMSWLELSAGGAAHVYHTTLAAAGTSSSVPLGSFDYEAHTHNGLGLELHAGVSVSPWRCGRGGVRAIWVRHSAALPGDVDLGSIGGELFVQVDFHSWPTGTGGARLGC